MLGAATPRNPRSHSLSASSPPPPAATPAGQVAGALRTACDVLGVDRKPRTASAPCGPVAHTSSARIRLLNAGLLPLPGGGNARPVLVALHACWIVEAALGSDRNLDGSHTSCTLSSQKAFNAPPRGPQAETTAALGVVLTGVLHMRSRRR